MTKQRRYLARALIVAIGAGLLLNSEAAAQHLPVAPEDINVPSHTTLTPTPDGRLVYDSTLNVTWLADANFARTEAYQAEGVTPSGAMSYAAAVAFVATLNARNYLGHSDWTLPVTPKADATCSANGPNGNGFGLNCQHSALGSLYYVGLSLQEPNTAVTIPDNSEYGFKNFQNYLYWSGSASGHAGTDNNSNGQAYASFSFASGYKGSNVAPNFLYVLPMIVDSANSTFPSGATVHDPNTGITWLADANLARSHTFGVRGINADGSMTHPMAERFIARMNARNWLGHNTWQLPPTPQIDSGCSFGNSHHNLDTGPLRPPIVLMHGVSYGFDCEAGAMGGLYYNFMHLTRGQPVVQPATLHTGPFQNIQPYLYWSCLGPTPSVLHPAPLQDPTLSLGSGEHTADGHDDSATGYDLSACGAAPAAFDFQFSFSLGNGFQGTDILANDLFVMVYFPGPPPGLVVPKAPGGGRACVPGHSCADPRT